MDNTNLQSIHLRILKSWMTSLLSTNLWTKPMNFAMRLSPLSFYLHQLGIITPLQYGVEALVPHLCRAVYVPAGIDRQARRQPLHTMCTCMLNTIPTASTQTPSPINHLYINLMQSL